MSMQLQISEVGLQIYVCNLTSNVQPLPHFFEPSIAIRRTSCDEFRDLAMRQDQESFSRQSVDDVFGDLLGLQRAVEQKSARLGFGAPKHVGLDALRAERRSEEHTSELQSHV